MKVLITGTHFTPAQALIEVLREKNVEIVYIGRKETMEESSAPSVESKILPRYGVKYLSLFAGGIQRTSSFYTITSFLKIPIGFIQAFFYLTKEKPDVVVSFGGYVGLPVVFSSWLLSIPVLIHEQTLVSGLSNKLSSIFASKIAVSFKSHELLKNKKAFFSGNPIRSEVLKKTIPDIEFKHFLRNAKNKKRKILLVTGGNQGSHTINEIIFELLPNLLKKYAIIHQTGDSKFGDFEKLNSLKESLENKEFYIAKKWIDVADWSYSLRNVDLIISRAGVNTLFEITYLNKKAIVIPFPFIYKDEQTKNAEYFSRFGLLKKIAQKDLTPKKLLETIDKFLKEDIRKLKLNLGITDAAKNLALAVLILASKNEI